MNYLDCPCLMKQDLEETEDVFSFININYPLPSILENLEKVSEKELQCTTCLLCTAFIKLSEQKSK